MTVQEKDWFEFIDQRLGPLMVFFLFVAIRNWERATFYAFTPDECHKMAAPMANILARLEKLFRLPGWAHTIATTSDDTVTLLFVFLGYFERTGILDMILPVFSIGNKETKKKYEGRSENNVQSAGRTEPVSQHNGYRGISRDDAAQPGIDPRQQYAIGSQYIPD